VEGTYGPDDASVKAIVDSSKQTPAKQQSPEGQDAGEYTSPACYAHLDAPSEVLKGDAHGLQCMLQCMPCEPRAD
jgi:hypothetical protein